MSLPDAGVKKDTGKPRFSLLPLVELSEVVDVLEFGAKKYSPDNWKLVPLSEDRYFDAAIRHILAFRLGEKLDNESGKSHLAHALCCLLFWMWHSNRRAT